MKPQIGFFTELLGPSLIINLAQLVSPSVALPAELVTHPGPLICHYRNAYFQIIVHVQ